MKMHSKYVLGYQDLLRWRLLKESGRPFINAYLKKFSSRETDEDFALRKEITYNPNEAKTCILEIRDSIVTRLKDIVRYSNSENSSYIAACYGDLNGVDGQKMDMFTFMCDVLTEALFMGRVGIFVDNTPTPGYLLSDKQSHPYLYLYRAEDIMDWEYEGEKLKRICLRDCLYPTRVYREMELTDRGVVVRIQAGTGGEEKQQETLLPFNEIPFHILDLPEPMAIDIVDAQIALMNLSSGDLAYLTRSNLPVLVEEASTGGQYEDSLLKEINKELDPTTGQEKEGEGKLNEVRRVIGSVHGIRYATGTDAPAYIHPSTEPTKISMEKQTQIKGEIRTMSHLSISALAPRRNSEDSKLADERPMEAGLRYLAAKVQHAERKTAQFWTAYENKGEVVTVNYPVDFSLKTDEERYNEADKIFEKVDKCPTLVGKKELVKQALRVLLEHKVKREKFEEILTSVDDLKVIVSDKDMLKVLFEYDVLPPDLFADSLSLPGKETVERALELHSQRAKVIVQAQVEAKAGMENKSEQTDTKSPTAKEE